LNTLKLRPSFKKIKQKKKQQLSAKNAQIGYDSGLASEALEGEPTPQQTLSFIDGSEDLRVYEYVMLVTHLDVDVVTVVQLFAIMALGNNSCET